MLLVLEELFLWEEYKSVKQCPGSWTSTNNNGDSTQLFIYCCCKNFLFISANYYDFHAFVFLSFYVTAMSYIPILLFILTQLKDLRHDNICAFIGACTEPPNICIITEYCSRGSLKDVLENEDVKLDNMFLASMVADIIRVSVEIQRKPIDANWQLTRCLLTSSSNQLLGHHLHPRLADSLPWQSVQLQLPHRLPMGS